jgi:hypothetical protein
MLAQIITEINAPDTAVGDAGAGVVAGGYEDDDYVFGSVHQRVEAADLIDSCDRPISRAHTCVRIL